MMRTHLRDEFELLLRIGALDEDEAREANAPRARGGVHRRSPSSRAGVTARRYAFRTMVVPPARWQARRMYASPQGSAVRPDESSAPGRRTHRSGLLERRGRRATRHLPADGEGALRRAPAEARSPSPSSDPGRVPHTHGRGPARTRPRRGRTRRGLTARCPRRAAGPRAPLSHQVTTRARRGRVKKRDCSPREPTREGTGLAEQRRHIVKRPRLTRLLDESEARIILLVAPAGYGKTTLTRDWVSDLSGPRVAWYRAESAAADSAALAAGLAEALSKATGGSRQRLIARLSSGGPVPEPVGLAKLVTEVVGGSLTTCCSSSTTTTAHRVPKPSN